MNLINASKLSVGITYKTAIEHWQSDYDHAEIRGYAHIEATLNENGTFTVLYWDRDWARDPNEFVVIGKKTLTREELLEDIKERNEFIERTIERYERQKNSNNAFAERVSNHK